MSPRMRPSATRRSTPSSATVVPKVFRRPRASMQAISSAPLLRCVGSQQVGQRETEALDRRLDPRPLLGEKSLSLRFQQEVARAGVHEHPATAPALDELLVDELL